MQRIYGKSSKARDCRQVAMSYNAARGEIAEQDYQLEELPESAERENHHYEEEQRTKTGKWKEFAANEQEEVFTIAAPEAMPKKPKLLSQKRSLDYSNEGGPSNVSKQARALGGGDALPDKREPPLAPARTHVPSQSTNAALPKQHVDLPLERALLDNNVTALAAPVVVAAMQGLPLERASTEPVLKPPPPPQQVGTKWGSFIDTDDVF
ncbi:hypothetical protein NADE_005102 [Nannochloris sp. 'desiccata']|nr:hypothetical protein KSW81_001968 [Chlorella desiccata (nom. nud.)]KAH7622517.1 hypothetical protein NADE_005102 [Chlorella desiccata (nom. nud.)]